MNFSEALFEVQNGAKATRHGWNAPDQWIKLQVPDVHSKMGRPYLYLSPVDEKLVPWTPTQSDLLTDDWELVE